jgi:hypothetical protein
VAKAILVSLVLLRASLWACSCAVSPVEYCERAPDLTNQLQAVFVGVVREFYPKSREQMTQLLDEFYRSHPEFRFQPSGAAATRRLAATPPGDQEFRREFIRFVWGDSLTTTEKEQIRSADQRELAGRYL